MRDLQARAKKKRSKYRAQRTTRGDLRFDSKKEANRFDELVILKRSGVVSPLLRQVPLDQPGGVKYRIDFLVFWDDGSVTYEDVKGIRTPMFIRNKKQVESLYPVQIREL